MSKRRRYVSRAILLVILALVLLISQGCEPDPEVGILRRQRYEHIYTQQLTVQNAAEFRGDVTQSSDLTVTGDTALGDAAGDTTTSLPSKVRRPASSPVPKL